MTFKIRAGGISQLKEQLSQGLEDVGARLLAEAKARAPVDTGGTRDSLHVDNTHSREWPRNAAVFVSTATGAGFFVHEGTVDTPAHPFLTMALDGLMSEIPSIVGSRVR